MSAKIATIDRYIATSGETKPASPRNGSELIETNTGAIYVYDGNPRRRTLHRDIHGNRRNRYIGNSHDNSTDDYRKSTSGIFRTSK